MPKFTGLIGAFMLVVAVTSCGGDSTGTAGGGGVGGGGGGGGGPCTAGTFCMGSSTFISTGGTATNPTVTVGVNTAVIWNNDSGGVQHDVTFDTPSAALAVGTGSAGNIPLHTSGSNARQFASAGTYHFHCRVHGTPMHGDVIVQ